MPRTEVQTLPESREKTPEDKILDWLLQLLEHHRDRDIADILGISSSAIWKIKKGQQRLKATELLTLHERLGEPVPVLGDGAFYRPENLLSDQQPQPEQDDLKDLFDRAYDHARKMDDKLPEEKRATQIQMLDRVFHILNTLQETPEAFD